MMQEMPSAGANDRKARLKSPGPAPPPLHQAPPRSALAPPHPAPPPPRPTGPAFQAAAANLALCSAPAPKAFQLARDKFPGRARGPPQRTQRPPLASRPASALPLSALVSLGDLPPRASLATARPRPRRRGPAGRSTEVRRGSARAGIPGAGQRSGAALCSLFPESHSSFSCAERLWLLLPPPLGLGPGLCPAPPSVQP